MMNNVNYTFILHKEAYRWAGYYVGQLRQGHAVPGLRLAHRLKGKELSTLSTAEFMEGLIRTKMPQIFAESALEDNSFWNQVELKILGDIGVAVPVMVFDNGKHAYARVHKEPFPATLLFIPGALLLNEKGMKPVDYDEVTDPKGKLDRSSYFELYERRVLPLFLHANKLMRGTGRKALITLPGIGCHHFAGAFKGQIGELQKEALCRLLEEHGLDLGNIKVVCYDPFNECEPERKSVHGIDFLVRPLAKMAREGKGNPQLCRPCDYEEDEDDFSNCDLFSVVAWDHVSWPGNDFYVGSRCTDDGVKAAATSSMFTITGVEGHYDPTELMYQPPNGYKNWRDVIQRNDIELQVKDNLLVYPA